MAGRDLGLSIVLRLPAGLYLAASLLILAGWLTSRPDLISTFSGSDPIPAQGAVLAALVSIAALLPLSWRWTRIIIAALAAILASLSVGESLFGLDFGIDWRNEHAWLGPDPVAGRATIGAAVATLLTAIVLMLVPAQRLTRRRQAIQILIGTIAVIALGSLFERLLDIGAVFGLQFVNRMPIAVAAGLLFFTLPLWHCRLPSDERALPSRDPAAALLSSGMLLLVAVSVMAGCIGLVSMRRGIEDNVRNNLLATVRTLGSVFETMVDERVAVARLAATRTGLLDAVQAATVARDDGMALEALQGSIDSVVGGDIRGIRVVDAAGNLLATSGRLAAAPVFARPLDDIPGARLVWDQRLLIDVGTDLVSNRGVLGKIVVEQELPALDTVLVQSASLAVSGNCAICGTLSNDQSRMECLPNRMTASPLVGAIRQGGRLLPVANGLAGLTGTIDTFDRRGIRVIAAFEPLPRLGLAIDVKVDTAELFAPVRARGLTSVPILIIIVICGSLVLRDRIAPLARQLVDREREARERGIALEDSRGELLHKNRVLDVALNNMTQGLVLYDAKSRLRAFNRRYEQMLGFPSGFLRGGLSHAAVRKRSAELGTSSVEEGVAMLLSRGSDANERQVIERRLRDGRAIELVHERLEEGGGVITLSDVTAARAVDDALRAAKDGAEAANRAKSEFLSMMSHEVRTPMNGVLGMICVLLDTELSAQQQKYVDTARSSAEALLAILDDILDFSKLEAGRLVVDNVTLDLAEFTESILAIMKPLAQEKSCALKLERSADLPRWIEIDSARLRQIILNLLSNAVKFTANGTVVLQFGVRPGAAEQTILSVTVADTGPGIAPDVLPGLFSRFTQADSSISRKYGGTGLGLAISKQLVELMGGTISVETVLGRGSTFRIDVPARIVAAPPASPPPEAIGPQPGARRLHIVVAEDNPVNQAVVTAMLAPYDYCVELVEDGAAAKALVERGGIDLVFMDIQMPGMDGLTATRAIRALRGSAGRVPIIALTANAMAGHREEYLAAGMNDYIAKPLRSHDLARALRRWGDGDTVVPINHLAPAVEPTSDASPGVDPARVAELAAIVPPDRLVTMLDAFFADGKIRLAAFTAARSIGDLEALRRAAHDIAGMSANYGLTDAEQLSRQIVNACRIGDAQAAWTLAAAAAQAFARAEAPLRQAVDARLATHGTAA
jgi:signal transduction histidine kinase/CheY-like chemotaxis protein/HPt (histidine-containing phosphotransfer) domain-containing protein